MESLSIIINSYDRLEGSTSNSNFAFRIPNLHTRNYSHVTVLQAIVPMSYYMVQEGQNYFYMIEDSVPRKIEIQPANYTLKALKANLIALLNYQAPGDLVYDILYPGPNDPDTGKFLYQVTGTYTSIQLVVMPRSQSNIFELLGFENGSTNEFVMGELESTNVLKIRREDQLVIHSDLCTNTNDNVLCSIFIGNSQPFGNVVYTNFAPMESARRITMRGSETCNFYLTNENGVPIDLQGLNMIMELLLIPSNEAEE